MPRASLCRRHPITLSRHGNLSCRGSDGVGLDREVGQRRAGVLVVRGVTITREVPPSGATRLQISTWS